MPEAAITQTARGPIEHVTFGSGPPVVLVHGTPGSWRQLMTLAEDLAVDRTTILPSRPGYGRTPIEVGRSFSEQADAYAALLSELGFDDAAIVGISGGGPSALAFARTHAATALVLGCAVAPHLIRIPRAMRVAASLGPVANLFAIASHAARRRRARRVAAGKLVGASLTPDDRTRLDEPGVSEALEAFVRSHAEAPPGVEGMRNDVRCFTAAQAPSDLGDLRLPVLVQHGDADTTVPLEHGLHHADAIGGVTLDVYEGAGHLYLVSRRRAATERIRTFLSANA